MAEKIYAEEFAAKVLGSDKLVVVDFFADWCGPCKMLAPVLETLSKDNPDISVYKINVDENMQLAAEYGISSIPNVLFFKNGEKVASSLGFVSKQQLQEIVDKNK